MKAVIQVDLDGLWTYRRYLRQEPVLAKDIDPVYSDAVNVFLEIFKKNSIKAAFFIVGADALIPEHEIIIRQIIDEGHEIANHSMSHPLNFNSLSDETLNKEIKESHDILERICGKKILGFKAPTFSINERILKIIKSAGYVYDSSVLPSVAAPLALNCAHSILKGRIANVSGLNIKLAKIPLQLYELDLNNMAKKGNSGLYELPISVVPFLRLPMHSTYVFMCGKWLFNWGMNELRKKRLTLNYLFHGIDLVDTLKHDLKLPFFGTLKKRRIMCEYIIKRIKTECEIVNTLDLIQKSDGVHDLCFTSSL